MNRLAALLVVIALALSGCSTGRSKEFSCTGNNVVAWGDSLTWSATKTPNGYQQVNPTWVQTVGDDLHVETLNFGEPTQGSAEIAVRQGGLQPAVTVRGNHIGMGDTPTVITAISPTDGWTQYEDAGTMRMDGTLANVRGTLEHTLRDGRESFTFVPARPLDVSVPVPPGTPFIGTQGFRYRDCVQIVWAGTNNPRQPQAIERDIASMVAWMAEPKRYLIVGTTEGTNLATTYGAHYINLRQWLIADGLAATGKHATRDDTAAIAKGAIPPTLTSDGTHFTPDAYTAIGHHLATVLKPLLTPQ